MAAKGTAAKSASGASMSKYDVEVEARLVALEAAVEELKSHTHSGGSDERVDKIIAHMAKKEDIGDIFLNHDIQKNCTCSWCGWLYRKSHGQTTQI